MCLILFSLNKHPKYTLIAAANRDEFYERPTADANYWKDQPHVLAGRDLKSNGTWMGVNKFGKIAMLTNYRDLSNIKENAPSRGHLVSDFLINNEGNDVYTKSLLSTGADYNGFNLLYGDRNKLNYYSNITEKAQQVKNGVHGLSNHLLDTEWPKVVKGKNIFSELIAKDDPDPEAFFDALYDDIKAPDNELPDTGVDLDFERLLSPLFIKSPDYGSRCSTIVMADKNGQWQFYERVYDISDFSSHTNAFSFKEVH